MSWTPAEYQAWWTAILAPYKPWLIACAVALCVEAACSVFMVIVWWRGGLR